MELTPINDTQYAETLFPVTSAGSTFHTIIAKATFDMHPGGVATVAEEQIPPVGADIDGGEPQKPAVRYETDFVPFKPQADVFCTGRAYAPEGRSTTETWVRFSVGPVNKAIRVVGNRHWEKTLGGMNSRISAPEPFVSLEVAYENAYGGQDPDDPEGYACYPLNPIGKGYTQKGKHLNGLPLPNLEDPAKPIKKYKDRQIPQSFGPIGRTWVPRIQRAGTYDQHWLENCSPELPDDFNEAYYNGAPANQQIKGYLKGTEEIQVDNMHPNHPHFRCRMPGVRVRGFMDWSAGPDRQMVEIPMNLDTLWVDMESLVLVLVWRGRVFDGCLEADTSVLITEETLDILPFPPDIYRLRLSAIQEEEQDGMQESDDAEMELAGMDTVSGPMPKADKN